MTTQQDIKVGDLIYSPQLGIHEVTKISKSTDSRYDTLYYRRKFNEDLTPGSNYPNSASRYRCKKINFNDFREKVNKFMDLLYEKGQ